MMANPFSKSWNYLMALFGHKLEQHADPKIQIQQAYEQAQHEHAAIEASASEIIGQQHQLSMQINRQAETVEKLNANVRQALHLADQAEAAGDAAKAAEMRSAAEDLAGQLTAAEAQMENYKSMHGQAAAAAAHAKQVVEQSKQTLVNRQAERGKLLAQLDQVKMVETLQSSQRAMGELTAGPSGNTPTLDEVRNKIERRYANAVGQAELTKSSVSGSMLAVQQATTESSASDRLAQIRAEMDAGKAITPGEPESASTGNEFLDQLNGG